MKESWEIKKLGEVCKLYQPKTISVEMFVEDGEYFVYGANGIIGHYNQYNHEDSEVLLTCRGATCGSVNISEPYSWINGNAMVVKPLDKNNIKQQFLKYYLISVDWNDIITGAAQPQITRLSLSPLPIPIPPLPEQERIVSELDLISGVIDKKKQQLKELDSLAQSLFYEMFGNPVENDKGWDVKKLGEVANSVNYGTSSPANDGGRYTYLRMNNLTYTGYLDLDDVKRIDIPDKDLEKCIVRKGDILFNRTNSKELVGKTALFDLDEEMVIAGYIIRVRVNVENVLPIYVVRYMNLPFMKSYFSGLCKGAVNQANINSKELKAISILVPPLPLQQEFASKIEKIDKQKELIKQSLKETETLFNSRMNFYFN